MAPATWYWFQDKKPTTDRTDKNELGHFSVLSVKSVVIFALHPPLPRISYRLPQWSTHPMADTVTSASTPASAGGAMVAQPVVEFQTRFLFPFFFDRGRNAEAADIL